MKQKVDSKPRKQYASDGDKTPCREVKGRSLATDSFARSEHSGTKIGMSCRLHGGSSGRVGTDLVRRDCVRMRARRT